MKRALLFKTLIIIGFLQAGNTHAQSKKSPGKGKPAIKPKLQITENYTVEVERDHQSHVAVIYLRTNGVKTDSLLISNFDGKTDSLINFENKWWHYIFSNCTNCTPDVLEDKHQFILMARDQRLHLAFVSVYRDVKRIRPRSPEIKTDSNEFFNSIRQRYGFYNEIVLNKDFFIGKPIVEEIFYCPTCNYIRLEEDGFKREIPIKFDERRQIFYNEKKILNGKYTFEPVLNRKTENKILKNEEVLLLKFYWATFAYYRGQWYYFFGKMFRPLDIIYSRCAEYGCR
jgi:hypothetical protein